MATTKVKKSKERTSSRKPKPFGDSRNRMLEAKKRLNLPEGAMNGVAEITPRILASIGSIEKAVEALRGDEDHDCQRFIAKYDSIAPSDRRWLRLEEMIVAAGLTPRRFMECLTGALMQQSADVTRILTAVNQHKVVEATIKAAVEERPILDRDGNTLGYTVGDIKAQEMFHKATGWLPVPKGAQMTVNLQQNNANMPQLSQGSDAPAEAPPTMDRFLMELQDVVKAKALPEPANEVPMNAPEVEYIEVEA